MKSFLYFAVVCLSFAPCAAVAADPAGAGATYVESLENEVSRGLLSNLELTIKDKTLSDSNRGTALVKVVQSALTRAAADAKTPAELAARAAQVAAVASAFLPEQADLFIDAVLAFPGVAEVKNAESMIVAAVAKALGEDGQDVETAEANRNGNRRHDFHGNRRDCVISKSTVRK